MTDDDVAFWSEYLVLSAEYEAARAVRLEDPQRWQTVKHKHAEWRTAMRLLSPPAPRPGSPVAQTADVSAEAEM